MFSLITVERQFYVDLLARYWNLDICTYVNGEKLHLITSILTNRADPIKLRSIRLIMRVFECYNK